MSGTLRLVLGDQLSPGLSALQDFDADHDVVLMAEVQAEGRYVPHHPQKIVLVLSAMRHFAAQLRARGLQVDYIELDAAGNSGTLSGELQRALQRHNPKQVVITEPGEWRVLQLLRDWAATASVPVQWREDDRFLCSRERFASWLKGRKAPRMEHFYRDMRRHTGWLMHEGEPEGGEWNYDADNREPLPASQPLPVRERYAPDVVTQQVMALVRGQFADHFGDIEGFGWPVTREQALEALQHFVTRALPRYGDYQDAMRSGDPWLFHSLLSSSLNIGLLLPREVCEAAIAQWRSGAAPLNAVEGFVRQILGWREYVRGLYWAWMPGYASTNHLQAQRPLPAFFWTGNTSLRCLSQVIAETRRNAYAHHIQRLMITGNFALLAGLAPAAVEQWYLAVYADAFEWVELPNTHGMVLHADGGLLASKPYAASGAYISRMSDYCKGCAYSPKLKTGTKACPFNYLYWDFLLRNREKLAGNVRLAMPYRSLQNMDAARLTQIREDAQRFLSSLDA